MHIAAAFPKALNEADLDEAEIERERAIATEKAADSGKPADIIAKMVEGGIAKYRKEHALVSQLFVMDGKTKISDVVAKAGKDAGARSSWWTMSASSSAKASRRSSPTSPPKSLPPRASPRRNNALPLPSGEREGAHGHSAVGRVRGVARSRTSRPSSGSAGLPSPRGRKITE